MFAIALDAFVLVDGERAPVRQLTSASVDWTSGLASAAARAEPCTRSHPRREAPPDRAAPRSPASWAAPPSATGKTPDLGLRLGLVEVRREIGASGGAVRFAARADAAWAELRTGAGEETIDGQAAAVNQVRAGAEASRPVRWDNGLSSSPFGELHVRCDGGAGQTGTGLEVVAGTRLVHGRVRADAQGRLLVLHTASGYRERGVGVTFGVGNRHRTELSLSVSPRWGDAATGGGTLWQEQVYRRCLPAAAGDASALDVRGEYGMWLPSGGLLTWFGSLSQSAYGKARPPRRVGVLDRMLSSGW